MIPRPETNAARRIFAGKAPSLLTDLPIAFAGVALLYGLISLAGYWGSPVNMQAHIDLRYPLRSLGLVGGLKGCEQQLGISRPGLENVNGFVAVLLWNEYRMRNNLKALETLLAYNIQDTLSLHTLMVHTHNEKVKTTPFSSSCSLPFSSLPESPFKADQDIVERVFRQAFGVGVVVFTSTSDLP